MSSGIFGVGLTGIRAAQLGLLTAEHNITNANTAGYTRQRIIQTTNAPVATGSGFIGQGTNITSIERLYSQTLVNQINSAQTNVSELSSYYAQIKQIDNLLADSNSGLSPAIQEFFRGVQDVVAFPAQTSSRQSLISSAQALVSRFQSMENRLNELYEGVGEQIKTTVATINSYSQQIADLNGRVVMANATSTSPPNDLLDQRDRLIFELNKLVEVSSRVDSDGSLSVFYGSGQQLVIGAEVAKLTAQASYADITRFTVGVQTPGGVIELPENLITGGELAGLLRFRNETLEPATNELGRVATSMALTFNAQHALGQDLLGQVSGTGTFAANFFTLGSPRVVANSQNTVGGPVVTASLINPPPVNANGNFYTDLTTSDYRLTFNAGTLTLTRLSDNATWSGANIAAINTALAGNSQGFTLAATAAPFANGDSYLIQPTREMARNIKVNPAIAADTRLVAAGSPIRTAAVSSNAGSASISGGTVATGYSLASLPVTLSYATAGTLSNFPNGTVSVDVGGTVTNYTITGPADTVPYTSGATITFAGMSVAISGTPLNGDQFRIEQNSSGVSDNRNALALGKLQTQNTLAGGTATYQGGYARLVSDIGNKAREIQVTGEAQEALLKQAQNSRESLSGVNLDEEAANLLRFQQAYQASAKAMDIGSKLFDVILSIRN